MGILIDLIKEQVTQTYRDVGLSEIHDDVDYINTTTFTGPRITLQAVKDKNWDKDTETIIDCQFHQDWIEVWVEGEPDYRPHKDHISPDSERDDLYACPDDLDDDPPPMERMILRMNYSDPGFSNRLYNELTKAIKYFH
jgi:hypothetical protein